MSMGSRIRRVTARVARLFAIFIEYQPVSLRDRVGAGPLSNQRTVKESRHDDRLGERVRSDYLDATPPSATTAPYRVLQFAMKYLF